MDNSFFNTSYYWWSFSLFLIHQNKHLKLTPFLKNLRDLLDFKVMILETILKILYLIITIFVILVSFSFIAVNFLTFLLVLIFGPIIVRIIYEASMMLIMIWKKYQNNC